MDFKRPPPMSSLPKIISCHVGLSSKHFCEPSKLNQSKLFMKVSVSYENLPFLGRTRPEVSKCNSWHELQHLQD